MYSHRIARMTTAWDILFIAIFWCLSLLITNPIGDFPLNDDWSYGLTVKHLIEDGDFRPTGWTSMPLITHVLWGAFFCGILGFSFNILRLSTLILSLSGVLTTYILMRELHQSRCFAVFAAVSFAFTPIYYALSHTFMTDAPFTAIMLIASVFFVRYLKTNSSVNALFATIFAIAATLSRQLAISVPLAFAVVFVLKNGVSKRTIERAILPPIACISVLLAFQSWLSATGRLPELYSLKNDSFFYSLIHPRTILVVAKNLYVTSLYLGWLLLPILLFIFERLVELYRKDGHKTMVMFILSISILMIGASSLLAENRVLMPNSGNIIIKSGIGPLTLHDTYILKLDNLTALPESFWYVVTIISLLGAVFLLTVFFLMASELAVKLLFYKIDGNEVAGAFLLLSVIIYLFPLLTGGFFDRYLVSTIPFLSAGIASTLPQLARIPRIADKGWRVAAVALVIPLTLFAIGGTRDYLAWNRLRWKALHELMENNHVKVEDIDGGFEFNGWYLYDSQYERDPRKSWWWVQRDTYHISFGSIPGYKVIKEYNSVRWLPPGPLTITVLQRDSI